MFTIPVLNIKADQLDALLAGIGYRLTMLAGSDNELFNELIADKQVTIQLGSDASNVARYYRFNNGKVSQHAGKADAPDLTINFKDSATGVKLLTKGNAVAFMTGIQNGDLTMQGDYKLLMWFSQLAKHIVPKIPEKYQPYVQQAKPQLEKAQVMVSQLLATAKQKLKK